MSFETNDSAILKDQSALESSISNRGFYYSPQAFTSSSAAREGIAIIANHLGTPIKGRNGRFIEELIPKCEKDANTNSLSEKFGLGTLPFHIDGAHHQIPTRYLIFVCTEAIGNVAPTLLLNKSRIVTTERTEHAFRHGVFLIKNGRNSFYANVKPDGSKFLRWDPGCMAAKDRHAELVAQSLLYWSRPEDFETIDWTKGSLLVVDNWEMLHARAADAREYGARTLLRATVK
jgi:hypothetical protein